LGGWGRLWGDTCPVPEYAHNHGQGLNVMGLPVEVHAATHRDTGEKQKRQTNKQ